MNINRFLLANCCNIKEFIPYTIVTIGFLNVSFIQIPRLSMSDIIHHFLRLDKKKHKYMLQNLTQFVFFCERFLAFKAENMTWLPTKILI